MDLFSFFILILKNLYKYIFGKKPFDIHIGKIKYFIQPRSDAYIILYETFVIELYKPNFKIDKIDTILDLGAYSGDFSLWALNKYNPQKIVSFEPDKELFELLEKNVEANHASDKIKIVRKAILDGSRAGFIKTKMASGNRIMLGEKNNLVETISFEKIFEEFNLDTLDYLKMDIEGGEKYVLTENNLELFSTRVKYVSMETHHNEIFSRNDCIKFFEQAGFKIFERKLFNLNTQLEAINTNLK